MSFEKATNFTDLEPMERPPQHGNKYDKAYPCPLCKTYGKWIYDLDLYGPGRHSRGHCSQCNGWGWVTEESKDCIHDYKELTIAECKEKGYQHWGNFWHVYECTKCQHSMSTDSSG